MANRAMFLEIQISALGSRFVYSPSHPQLFRHIRAYIALQLSGKYWYHIWTQPPCHPDKTKRFSMKNGARNEVASHMAFWLACCHMYLWKRIEKTVTAQRIDSWSAHDVSSSNKREIKATNNKRAIKEPCHLFHNSFSRCVLASPYESRAACTGVDTLD